MGDRPIVHTGNGGARRVNAPRTVTGNGQHRGEPERLPVVTSTARPSSEAGPPSPPPPRAVPRLRRQRNLAVGLALLASVALIVFALVDRPNGGSTDGKSSPSFSRAPAPVPFVPVGYAFGAQGSAILRPRGEGVFLLSLSLDVPKRPLLIGLARRGTASERTGAKLLGVVQDRGNTRFEQRVSLRTLAGYDALEIHVFVRRKGTRGAKSRVGPRPILRVDVLDLMRASRVSLGNPVAG
jgi:hypothetical protein